MSPVRKVCYLLRYFGPRIAWLRAGVYAARFTGHTRRVYRPRPWEHLDLAELMLPGTPADPDGYAAFKRRQAPPFLFALGRPPVVPEALRRGGERRPALAERLKLLADDRCVYFFHQPSPAPIDWNANPFDGTRAPAGRLWADIPDYRPEQGDPRMLWEPARAAWAIDLARAGSHGCAADAGGLLWRWIDSFMAACPPYLGFQWKCGQESAVRFIALALGCWSLADDPAMIPPRWTQLARLAWATGYRIAHHINYAISQKNNHAISEACGLLLIGQLFPELRDAAAWEDTGRRVLARELRRQIYADGSYVQHSMNYQRVMLAGALLALRLAERRAEVATAGDRAPPPFERDLYDRLGRAGEFLYQMMDPDTGRLPQHGNNDGAHILPLNECDFTDFRPVIQATHYLVTRTRRLPPGPWDEDLLWLFGPAALDSRQPPGPPPRSRAFPAGGYYTLRGQESWGLIRCHTYRDRPAHADALHLDLWYRGQNVLVDAGTYKYYIPGRPDLEHYFKSIESHNTVAIDGGPPMELVSRFLWLPWPRARTQRFEQVDGGWCFEGEHFGYARRPWHVRHARTVLCRPDDQWIVVDDLRGAGEHETVLRWHLLDAPAELDSRGGSVMLHTPAGDFHLAVAGDRAGPRELELVRGRDTPGRVQGLAAPYYGSWQPRPTLEARFRAELPLRIVTVLSPVPITVLRPAVEAADRQEWEVGTAAERVHLRLASPARRGGPTLLQCAAAPAAAVRA